MLKSPHSLTIKEVLSQLDTKKNGLSTQNAGLRHQKYGFNRIYSEKETSWLQILFRQIANPLVAILAAGMIFAFLSHETVDAIVILIILVLNTAIGFWQELKAEKAIESLKSINHPNATVLRDGTSKIIDSEELVPGDILIINTGDKVSADVRLIESVNLKIDEALLTGESEPETKSVDKVSEKIALGDRTNMAFSGTIVTYGRGKGVVVNTGKNSQIGQIAELVQTQKKEQTPLELKIDTLSKKIGVIVVFLIALIIGLGVYQERELFEIFELGISLAVSAVPEGLPVIVTITLALGVRRMLDNKALIRRLPVVEVLGSSDVICTDKTGTITTNQMTVKKIITRDFLFEFSGDGFNTEGEIIAYKIDEHWNKSKLSKTKKADYAANLNEFLSRSVVCNDATISVGDPTERALIIAAAKNKLDPDKISDKFERLNEVPFSSETKFMITENKEMGSTIKGAPEQVVNFCDYIQTSKGKTKLSDAERKNILDLASSMSSSGLRLLGLGYSNSKWDKITEAVQNGKDGFVFIGLVAMVDPPRKEAAEAIQICYNAGIRVVMITGDHEKTALSIAKEVGIETKGVINGETLAKTSVEKLKTIVEEYSVFARVTSQDKLNILKALQANGHVVGMGGDGVNDAPAIKKADIGFSVGSGTDLTKEVADMILLNDNFATIPKAIKEGRTIYSNIRNFIKLLLSSNFDEILVIVSSILFNLPVLFAPIHILWINLLTDGLPAIALSTDTADSNIMKEKPRDKNESIFENMFGFIFIAGFIAFLVAIFTFFQDFSSLEEIRNMSEDELILTQTKVFARALVFEFLLVFVCRTKGFSFGKKMFNNPKLLGALLLSVTLTLSVIYIPFLNDPFNTTPLNINEWSQILVPVVVGIGILEGYKLVWYMGKKF